MGFEMDGFSWSFALSLLALACSAAAVVLAGRTAPSAFAKKCQNIAAEAVGQWKTEVALFEATRERWGAEFAAIADRCDELLDRTESKRRRFAAAESKQNAAHPANEQVDPYAGLDRNGIIDLARRRRMGG